MKILEKTFDTPEENLACEEALLLDLEKNGGKEILRFWEPKTYFVVLGHANKVSMEVNRQACKKYDIPIYRRFSGGGTVVNGPGCLNYSLFLLKEKHPQLESIQETNRYVLSKMAHALYPLANDAIEFKGTSDLTIGGKKFSGNAQNRKQRYVLFHGTILYDFDLALIEHVLLQPSRQPEYRQDRVHNEFVMNFHAEKVDICRAILNGWKAVEILEAIPENDIKALVISRYTQGQWNYKF